MDYVYASFGGTVLFRWRLHRVRRRRNQLRRAEWLLGDERADRPLGLP